MVRFVTAALALAAAAASAEPPLPPLTPDGWGPVRIGMTRDEVFGALGARLTGEALDDPDSCIEMVAAGGAYPGLVFMFQRGRLTRLSAHDESRLRTPRGIGIGAGADDVRRAYGPRLEAEPHEYVGLPAEYLTYWLRGGERGVRFETGADRRVETIHAGTGSIRYIEGCA